MKIIKSAQAGTLESCDASVTVEPSGSQVLELIVESASDGRFSERIREASLSVLAELGVESAKITVRERSALDCTVRARVAAACLRAAGRTDIPWESFAFKGGLS